MSTPRRWRLVPLEEFVTLQRGFDLPTRRRVPGHVPVLSSGETQGFHNEARVTGPGFAVGRATNLGRPTWSEVDFWPLNTVLYAKDFHGNVPKFAYYWFLGSDLSSYNSGSVQPMLNRNYIAKVPVQLPPVDEQRAIAATLGALDDKIESNDRAVGLAEQLGQTLFAATATHFRPLVELALLTMGSSPPGSSYNEDGDGLPFYQGVRDFGVRYPTVRVWTNDPRRIAEPNDTLLSVRAPVGRLNRAAVRCCVGRGVASVRAANSPSTLYYSLRHSSHLWEPYEQEGTVFGAINRRDLANAQIPWVSDGHLSDLETKLASLDDRIESFTAETRTLAQLRDSLLPELLSGRIKVSEARETIEETIDEEVPHG